MGTWTNKTQSIQIFTVGEEALLQGMPKDGVTDQQVNLQWKALMEFFKAGGVVPLLSNVSNPTLMVKASSDCCHCKA